MARRFFVTRVTRHILVAAKTVPWVGVRRNSMIFCRPPPFKPGLDVREKRFSFLLACDDPHLNRRVIQVTHPRHFDLSELPCDRYDVVPGGLWSVRLPLEKATGTGPSAWAQYLWVRQCLRLVGTVAHE